MASSKIKGLMIKIGADTQGLDTALKNVESKGKQAAKELREIDAAMTNAGESAALWSQKQKVLSIALEESRKKLEFLEKAQEQVEQQFNENRINGEQYRAFQREVEYARAAVERYESSLTDAYARANDLGRASGEAADEVDDLGDNTEDAGRQADSAANGGFTVLKGALADLVADGIRFAAGELKDFTGDIIRTGMTYEASMSNVAAISGATSAEMERLSEKAQEMGATTKFTAAESADAFSYMALAGWKAEDMLSGIDGVLDLAAASNMDLARASDIVTDYLTAFGLTASDSSHFVDVMTYAMANSNTTTDLLGEAYKNCAATAASMGYSAEETTAVLMTMANAGIKGGEAGTALNAIMTRLATDTKNCATELKNYGVDVYDAEGNMQSLSSILEGVSGVWHELTDEQQANLAKQLAGTNHYAALQTIMNGLSDSAKESGMSFGDYSKALEECDGAASDMSRTMMDNLQGDMTLLSSAVDGMKLSLSKELNPEIRKGVQYLTKNIPAIERTLSKFFKGTISAVKTVAGWIPDIISAVQKFKPVIIGTLSAIAAYKVLDKISTGIDLLKKLTVSGIPGLLGALGPVGAAAIGVGVLTTAFIALHDAHKKEKSIAEKVAEQYKNEQKAAGALRDSLSELNDRFYESAAASDFDAKRTEELWKELDSLTDSTGKVRDADKKRAEYILGELNDALGTEYTMTGNQIDRYKDMEAEIDTLIAKKRASAYLDSYLAQSADYAKAESEALTGYENAYVEYSKYDEALKLAMKKLSDATGIDQSVLFTDDGYYRSTESKELEKNHSDPVIRKLYEEWETALANRDQNSQLMSSYKESYNEAINYRSRLDEAERAFSNGSFDEVKHILYDPEDANRYTLKYESDIEKREEAFRNLIEKSKADFRLAINGNSQYAVDEAMKALGETFNAGALTGTEAGRAFSKNFSAQVQQLVDKGFDISQLAKWAKNSGIKVGDAFTGDFSIVIQSQIDKGYDTTALMEWARNSGLKMTDVFGKNVNFKEVISAQLDEGHDITKLLAWAEESGFKIGEKYDKKFMEKIQEGLNSFDPQTGKLFEWAVKNGIALGEVFSEGFYNTSTYNRYIYETNDLIISGINSWGDYIRWKNGEYAPGEIGSPVQKHATGGFIGIGQEGIVAEAGPELLTVMNGGVRVTPLSRSARNTAVGSGDTINYYQTFNVTANVSNDYDVRSLSQKLGRLVKSTDFGKGLA